MLLIRYGEAVAPLSSIPVREGFRNSSPCSSKADQVSVFQTNVLGASITLKSPCTQTSTSCTQIAPRLQLHASLLCHLCLLHSGCGADNFLSAPHVVRIRPSLMILHGVVSYLIVLHGIARYYMALHGRTQKSSLMFLFLTQKVLLSK